MRVVGGPSQGPDRAAAPAARPCTPRLGFPRGEEARPPPSVRERGTRAAAEPAPGPSGPCQGGAAAPEARAWWRAVRCQGCPGAPRRKLLGRALP